ncbi:MAG: hypothetical protein ABEJ40_04975 [Haloarculaceae archaeon]
MRRFGPGRRGQFVLLAGVVVAIALVGMLTAYLQLGYRGDVGADDVDDRLADGRAYLDRATHEAARAIRGEHDWSERGPAVTAVRVRLRSRLGTLERARVDRGVAYSVVFNRSAAREWAGAHCPHGRARQFGDCEADRGVVVQERDGRTLVLAVAYDLSVTTDAGETRLVTVVNATG